MSALTSSQTNVADFSSFVVHFICLCYFIVHCLSGNKEKLSWVEYLPWSTFNDDQFTRFCTARCATQRVARVCLRQLILDLFRAVLYRQLLRATKSTNCLHTVNFLCFLHYNFTTMHYQCTVNSVENDAKYRQNKISSYICTNVLYQ